jgi:hypothetical protein
LVSKEAKMRKNGFLVRMLAIALAFGMVLAGCTDTGGDITTYTVDFAVGDGGGTPPASQTVNSGQSITLPGQGNMTAPTSKSFNGWKTGGQNYAAGVSYTVNGNVTFIARWETIGGGDITPYMDGVWSRSGGRLQFIISGSNWVYAEDGNDFSRGTWSVSVPITAPASGTLTLTITEVFYNGGWMALPAEYNAIKTNTANFTLNDTADTLTISDAAFDTPGVWGTTEGTYIKQ